ncbi:MAG TPA: prepilin-type N-terminal cleavage/methylation domain-containing protein [Desulforhopalus sp.]|nr:prepilin-type N-terminal cleavage/methylation domain-containing protein [Desulforhopalus sp.]
MSRLCRAFFLTPLENSRAFTLLEVMIALAIIATTLVTLFGSQARSLSLVVEAQFNNTAPLLAAGKLAELTAGDLPAADTEGDFGADFPGYRWQLTVADAVLEGLELPTGVADRLQRVELRLDGTAPGHSYTLVWYGFRGG